MKIIVVAFAVMVILSGCTQSTPTTPAAEENQPGPTQYEEVLIQE